MIKGKEKDVVHFIYGRTGSGKSSYVSMLASKSKDKHVFVLVPDRAAVLAETRFAAAHNAGEIDVVTFRRLCNFVFRRYGGICENYISRGAKKVMMHNTVKALSDLLSSYKDLSQMDTSATEKLLSMRTELSRSCAGVSLLGNASEKATGETAKKFYDMMLIFSSFDAEVEARFSDPDGMISKMNALLSKNDFFRDCDVYIDSFSSFSADQLETVKQIIKSADNVYITLPFVPSEDSRTPCFFGVNDTRARLLAAVADAGIREIDETVFIDGRRFENEELSFLSRNLFPGSANVSASFEKEPEHIHALYAANAFAESEAVCIDIARRVREGARYRDIAVIVRNTDSYVGIIDAMMRKYGIPYFISSRTDIAERAFIKFLLCALAVCERGFGRELVISYIKTDFAGITPDEINLFENYVRKWNITGSRFYDEYEWNMDPDGFRGEMSEQSAKTLMLISDIRARAIKPLRAFCEDISGRHSVRYFCEKLYEFALSLKAPEKIKEDAEIAIKNGEKALATELSQLFSVFCGVLDALVSASAEVEVNVAEFSSLFRLVLSETDIGKIPTSLDEVTVYDASAGGYGEFDVAYIMGACEGAFPASVDDDGLFSDKEKQILSLSGIEITSTVERRICDELYYFYCAACSPKKELYITYPIYDRAGKKTRRSPALSSILSMFPKMREICFESMPRYEMIERKCASFEHIMQKNSSLSRALAAYYAEDDGYADKMKYIFTPLSSVSCRVPAEDAKKLFPKDMHTSYSRLEKYIVCNFSYFCEYELKLKDSLPVKFGALDVGNFMHKILEVSVRYALSHADATDEEIKKEIEFVCRTYVESLCREKYAAVSPRLLRLTDYLSASCEKFVLSIRNEFKESKFRARDFEVVIGKGEDIEPIRLESENGCVELRGKVDRVDTYEDGEGKIYIRVADYKTGSKKFELSNVEKGRDLQMLLYLFSICENGKKKYGDNLSPAGVMYVSVRPSAQDVDLGSTAPEEKNKNSGLLLDNDEVLTAMEPSLEGKFIPVSVGSGGKKKGSLISEEAFASLKEDVVKTVLAACDELRSGKADACPEDKSACEYCKMHAVCRVKK